MNHKSRIAAREARSPRPVEGGDDIKLPRWLREELPNWPYQQAKEWVGIYVGLTQFVEAIPEMRRVVAWVEEGNAPPAVRAQVEAVVAEIAEDVATIREIFDRWAPLEEPPAPTVPTWVPQSRASHYRITVEDGTARLVAQDYRCAVCRKPFETPKRVRFDHNHATGEFRGFLCASCNTGLGQLKDSIAVLRSALAYLEEYGSYGPEELPT